MQPEEEHVAIAGHGGRIVVATLSGEDGPAPTNVKSAKGLPRCRKAPAQAPGPSQADPSERPGRMRCVAPDLTHAVRQTGQEARR